MNCKICGTKSNHFFDDGRSFFKCPFCSLIFTKSLIDTTSTDQHYKSQWENQSESFWNKNVDVFLSIVQRYHNPRKILDFGSGSGGLTAGLQKRGFDATPLEPMIHGYLKDKNFPENFDVVVALEVIEHLPNVRGELHEIEKVLTSGGIMLFTTLLTNSFINTQHEKQYFKNWIYKDDQTHVNFFCNKTISVIADLGNYDIDIFGNNVFVIRRQAQASIMREGEVYPFDSLAA